MISSSFSASQRIIQKMQIANTYSTTSESPTVIVSPTRCLTFISMSRTYSVGRGMRYNEPFFANKTCAS